MLIRTANKLQSGRFEWDFGHGYSSYKKDQAEVAQDVETALYEFKYNCFFDLESGIDWVTRLGKKNQKESIDNDVKNTIVNRYGVLGINDFTSNVIDRTYNCSCYIYTIYSDTPYKIEFSQGV